MEELTYEELREVQKRERSTAMLSELPEDFYAKAGNLISQLKARVDTEFALEKAREYENAVKVLRDIYSIREQKILLRALRAAKEGSSIAGLAAEERVLFEKVKEAVGEGERMFAAAAGIATSQREGMRTVAGTEQVHAPPEPTPDGRKLRITAQIPQFVGVGGKRYGPFGPGEIVFLPLKESEMLLKRKLAVEA